MRRVLEYACAPGGGWGANRDIGGCRSRLSRRSRRRAAVAIATCWWRSCCAWSRAMTCSPPSSTADARPGECQARSGLPRLFGGPREDRLARLSLGLPEFLAARGGDGVRPPAEKAGFLVRLQGLQKKAPGGAGKEPKKAKRH